MKINNINIKNFTVFEDIKINFSKGVNILIGENGTGKTHVLKLLYSIMDICKSKTLNKHEKGINYSSYLSDYFLVSEKNNDNLVRDMNKECIVSLDTTEENIEFQVYYKDKNNNLFVNNIGVNNKINATKDISKIVFIPAKEMLSNSKGLLALEREREIPFDKTLIDIVSKSQLGEKKKQSILGENTLKILSKVIDGEVVFKNDSFYIVKNNGLNVEFSAEAEGIRKFALLLRLIANGVIDNNTILFWDEPEANINPKLVPILVDVLLELVRNNIQIFIATHDYNLAKYFEVKRKENEVVQFNLLDKRDDKIYCETNNYFGKIKNNPIIDADSTLLDEVLDKNLGD